jgi:anti-sigma regulatory factor (Ser/Thr protein kinase)
MDELTAVVEHDLDRGLTVVAFAGELSLSTTRYVRAELLKRVAECPLAIVVDLDRVTVTSAAALTVFPAVERHQGGGPLVPLVLCAAPASAIGVALRKVVGSAVGVYPSRAGALAAAVDRQAAIRRVDAHLTTDPRSARHARRLVADACDRWHLAGLKETAILVVSELVSNAVRYAGTDFDLTATLRGSYLHIAVRDRNPQPPLMPAPDPSVAAASSPPPLHTNGRGLQLVDASAAAWGTTVAGDGKIVWATISTGGSTGNSTGADHR